MRHLRNKQGTMGSCYLHIDPPVCETQRSGDRHVPEHPHPVMQPVLQHVPTTVSQGHGSAQSLRSLQGAPGQPQKHDLLRQLYWHMEEGLVGAKVVKMLVTRLVPSTSTEVEAGTLAADGKMEAVEGVLSAVDTVRSAVVLGGGVVNPSVQSPVD